VSVLAPRRPTAHGQVVSETPQSCPAATHLLRNRYLLWQTAPATRSPVRATHLTAPTPACPFSQYTHRDRRSPITLTAHAPVFQPVRHRRSPNPFAFANASHLLLRLTRSSAPSTHLSEPRPHRSHRVRQLGSLPLPFGAMTRRTGKPYFCANSKSRSSCAGTHIIAPVP